MKLSKIMLAVATLAVSSAATSAPINTEIAYSTGASATKNNLKAALTTMCASAAGTLNEFASGGNISTYTCGSAGLTTGSGGTYASNAASTFKKFAGTQFSELRLNTAAGSFSSVRGLNGIFVDDLGADLKFRDPILVADRTQVQLVADRAGVVFVGGLLDVQPTAFPPAVLAGLTVPATPGVGVQQAFGVAVSIPLYTEMFNSQKSAGGATVDKPIPSTCAVTDTAKLECVPTIGKGQMAAIMSSTDTNAAYTNGANFLATTLASGTELRYIRRPNTSGTQASAQNYFLGLPCSATSLSVVDEPLPSSNDEVDTVAVTGFTPAVLDLNDVLVNSIRVLLAGGTTNVRQELSKPTVQSGNPNYAIGVMSGENNQTTGNSFRWLRVQGAAMSENAAPANGQLNRQAVINGSYDFYFESVYAPGTGAGAAGAFWAPVSNTLKTIAGSTTGLIRAADQLYTKVASCAASTAN